MENMDAKTIYTWLREEAEVGLEGPCTTLTGFNTGSVHYPDARRVVEVRSLRPKGDKFREAEFLESGFTPEQLESDIFLLTYWMNVKKDRSSWWLYPEGDKVGSYYVSLTSPVKAVDSIDNTPIEVGSDMLVSIRKICMLSVIPCLIVKEFGSYYDFESAVRRETGVAYNPVLIDPGPPAYKGLYDGGLQSFCRAVSGLGTFFEDGDSNTANLFYGISPKVIANIVAEH